MAVNIGNADISRLLLEHVKVALRGTNIKVYKDGDEPNLTSTKVAVFVFVNPGAVFEAERGGPRALSRRVGTLRLTVSLQYKGDIETEGLPVCDLLEAGFRMVTLYNESKTGRVVCDEPYTENRGKDPTSRYILITTVPWHVFFRQES